MSSINNWLLSLFTKNGFYYPDTTHTKNKKARFSKFELGGASVGGACLPKLDFYKKNIKISYFQNMVIDNKKLIITVYHFAVTTEYLDAHNRGAGEYSLKAFAKQVRKHFPTVKEIKFRLNKNATANEICNFCLAKKRYDLFDRIGATDVKLKNNGSFGDGSVDYIVVATWRKSNWQ